MRFDGEMPSGSPSVLLYRFRGAGSKVAYVAWCATSEDKRVPGFRLKLPGTRAQVVRFRAGSQTGADSEVAATGGVVAVDLSETPVLVFPR
jgi:hypothetical protein